MLGPSASAALCRQLAIQARWWVRGQGDTERAQRLPDVLGVLAFPEMAATNAWLVQVLKAVGHRATGHASGSTAAQ